MTRQTCRLRSERRCDCAACLGYRLAVRFFVAGLVAIMLLGALLHAGEPTPLLIDQSPAAEGGDR